MKRSIQSNQVNPADRMVSEILRALSTQRTVCPSRIIATGKASCIRNTAAGKKEKFHAKQSHGDSLRPI
jgi:hypothetical protein